VGFFSVLHLQILNANSEPLHSLHQEPNPKDSLRFVAFVSENSLVAFEDTHSTESLPSIFEPFQS